MEDRPGYYKTIQLVVLEDGTIDSFIGEQQPTSWLNHKHRGVELNMNETYEEKEGYNDLAQIPISSQVAPPITKDLGAVTSWATKRNVGRNEDSRLSVQRRQSADVAIEWVIHAKFLQSLAVAPQLDGIDDKYDDVVVEDYNEPEEDDNAPPSATTPTTNVEPPEPKGSKPPLNEDDDDDVDEADNGDKEPAINHLVLAQFDKVT